MSKMPATMLRGVAFTLIALESLVVPIALLGLIPTDDTNYPGTIELYWLTAAGGGVLVLLIILLAMRKLQVKL